MNLRAQAVRMVRGQCVNLRAQAVGMVRGQCVNLRAQAVGMVQGQCVNLVAHGDSTCASALRFGRAGKPPSLTGYAILFQ